MNKQEIIAEGLVGLQVEFDIQELIAIKDKWSLIIDSLENYKERGHSIVKIDIKYLEEMNVLMQEVLKGIESTQEVHDRLFVKKNEQALQSH